MNMCQTICDILIWIDFSQSHLIFCSPQICHQRELRVRVGIELKWDLISSENLRGKLSSYKIHYQEVSSLDLKDSK